MKINWLPLYVPPVYFFLLGGGSLLVVSGIFLILAVTTHRYLLRMEKRRKKLREDFTKRNMGLKRTFLFLVPKLHLGTHLIPAQVGLAPLFNSAA